MATQNVIITPTVTNVFPRHCLFNTAILSLLPPLSKFMVAAQTSQNLRMRSKCFPKEDRLAQGTCRGVLPSSCTHGCQAMIHHIHTSMADGREEEAAEQISQEAVLASVCPAAFRMAAYRRRSSTL